MAVKKTVVLNKTDFIKRLANDHALTQKEAKGALEAVLETITAVLGEGNSVRFTGFGTLTVNKRAARVGIKPGTSEKIKIPAHKVVAFKAGNDLKTAVNAKKSKKK